MNSFEVVFSPRAVQDLELVFDHLKASHRSFGHSSREAGLKAAERVKSIRAGAGNLADAAHQGTLRPELGEGVRSVTKDQAVFSSDLDEAARAVRVLAVFFGGRDHLRIMARRLLD